MGRKRVIYQSEVLYTKPIQYHEYLNNSNQLLRVQDISHGVELNKTDINEFGQLEAVERKIIEPPTVSLDFSYYLHGGRNEKLIGFSMTPDAESGTELINSVKKFLSGDVGQNYYIGVSGEGNDAKIEDATNVQDVIQGVIGIGNGYITSYSVEAAVGDIPSASVSVEASNIEFNGNAGAPALNIPNPAINVETGDRYDTTSIVSFPKSSHTGELLDGSNYEFAALRPGDIEVDFDAGPDAEEGNGAAGDLSIGGAKIDGSGKFHLQSFTLDVPLSREALNRLGSVHPYSRELETPLTITFTCSAFLSDLEAGSLNDILCSIDERNIRVKIWEPCPTGGDRKVVQAFLIKGASLDSQNFSASIGENKTVDLTFSAQIGGANSTSKGLFMWQNSEVVDIDSSASPYSLTRGETMLRIANSGGPYITNVTVEGGDNVEIEFTPDGSSGFDYSATSGAETVVGEMVVGETDVFVVNGIEVTLEFIALGSYIVNLSANKIPESEAEGLEVGETLEAYANSTIHFSAPEVSEVGEEVYVDVEVSTGNDVLITIPYLFGSMSKFELSSNGEDFNFTIAEGTTDAHYIGGNIVQIENVDASENEAIIVVRDVSEQSLDGFNPGVASVHTADGYREDGSADLSGNNAITIAGWLNSKGTILSSGLDEKRFLSIGSLDSGEPSLALHYTRESSGDRRITEINAKFQLNDSAAEEEMNRTLSSPQDNDEWVHFGVVANPGTQEGKIYQDGTQVGSTFSVNSGTIVDVDGQKVVALGSMLGESGVGQNNADFAELGVWSKELTADEFAELANTTTKVKLTEDTGDYVSSDDLQVYFPGVNPGVNLLVDHSGNGNHVVMTDLGFDFIADGPFSS